jgi:hypothetical protein
MSMNPVAIAIFVALFAFVTLLGFAASRWRRGDLNHLHEWGLGGRRFGTVVTWFLLGGDLYTAYTFIAVPALMFGAGAMGFFAVPYTVLVYPLMFAVFPRLWAVAHAKGYVTAADFVRGRFDSHALALAVAVTGIVATMPYRFAACRHGSRHRRAGHSDDDHNSRLRRSGRTAACRLRRACCVHLQQRFARARDDRRGERRAAIYHRSHSGHRHSG